MSAKAKVSWLFFSSWALSAGLVGVLAAPTAQGYGELPERRARIFELQRERAALAPSGWELEIRMEARSALELAIEHLRLDLSEKGELEARRSYAIDDGSSSSGTLAASREKVGPGRFRIQAQARRERYLVIEGELQIKRPSAVQAATVEVKDGRIDRITFDEPR